MHFNRKKISGSKLKITPTGKKKKKRSSKNSKSSIKPIVRSKTKNKKNKKLRIIKGSSKVPKVYDRFKYKKLSKCKNLLKGETAFILGNGPSISSQNLKKLDPYLTIGINRIFYIYDPTILIWQDHQLWNSNKKNIMSQRSIRVSSKKADPRKFFLNYKLALDPFKFKKNPSRLHGRGNTGALAAQLAVALGCSNIVLLGIDCKYENGKTDFYGKNKDHKEYTMDMCKEAIKWIKEECPVPIYNCSTNDLWEQKKLKDVINELKPKKMYRAKYIKLFKK